MFYSRGTGRWARRDWRQLTLKQAACTTVNIGSDNKCFICLVRSDVIANHHPSEFTKYRHKGVVEWSPTNSNSNMLDKLPAEVLLQTFSHLHYRDLVSVGRTCKQLLWLSKDDFLLQRIADRDFGDHFSSYSDEDISLAVFLGTDTLTWNIKYQFASLVLV